MRNREIWFYLTVAAVLSALFILLGFASSTTSGWLCTGLAFSLTALGGTFTLWRYRQIKKLSEALSQASAKGQVLDLRSNREGELSILENDLYKITSALADKADHLHEEKVFLSNALSDISHQLKTPLTSLLVHSDLLQNDNLPTEKRKEFLASISSQLERIRWLVSSLLKMSRIDAAVVDFKAEPIILHHLLTRTMEPFLTLAEQKSVSLVIECPRTLSWKGDPDWTQEALGNIIKNCVEHAPNGGYVSIKCVDNPLHTLITIQDNGNGFTAKDLPHLFERFYRGDNATPESVGIGLAMAKSILQAQRGDVSARNAPEGGALFSVKLYK